MSLSTFSGHVANLVAILRSARERSLVLVDELASGTDPVEGSALAQALLTRLASQARLTVVTTHYPELKEWASATEDVANAATGFDPDTHAPLYRIALGRPGTSHALRIAERLGLDGAVVEDARDRIVPERRRIEELLAQTEAAERIAVEERTVAARERAEAEQAVERARAHEAELESEIEEVRASAAAERERAAAEAERDLTAARQELQALRDEIRVAKRRERDVRRTSGGAAVRAERERDRRLGAASARAAEAERAIRSIERPLPVTGPLAAGDPGGGADPRCARHDRIDRRRRGGGDRCRWAPHPDPARAPSPRSTGHGERVGDGSRRACRRSGARRRERRARRARDEPQDAREAVRSFVDDASLVGLTTVRVVHGRGTGAVRAAVRDELDRHPLVERRESESADGATVAHLVG